MFIEMEIVAKTDRAIVLNGITNEDSEVLYNSEQLFWDMLKCEVGQVLRLVRRQGHLICIAD